MTTSNRLQGCRILVTRTREQASSFSEALAAEGAEVIEIPTIEIVPCNSTELDQTIREIGAYDWLFFTSVNGVNRFFERWEKYNGSTDKFPKICSIGPATSARVKHFGYDIDVQPKIYQAEGVIEAFSQSLKGKIEDLRILLPRAASARDILPRELRAKKAIVREIHVYRTNPPTTSRQKLRKLLSESPPDLVTLTSSSTARNFCSLSEGACDITRLHFAAIGPITAATAKENNMNVVCMPEKATIPDLVESISDYYAKSQ